MRWHPQPMERVWEKAFSGAHCSLPMLKSLENLPTACRNCSHGLSVWFLEGLRPFEVGSQSSPGWLETHSTVQTDLNPYSSSSFFSFWNIQITDMSHHPCLIYIWFLKFSLWMKPGSALGFDKLPLLWEGLGEPCPSLSPFLVTCLSQHLPSLIQCSFLPYLAGETQWSRKCVSHSFLAVSVNLGFAYPTVWSLAVAAWKFVTGSKWVLGWMDCTVSHVEPSSGKGSGGEWQEPWDFR